GYYANANDIGRVGMAFYESNENQELRCRYYTQAVATIWDIRATCSPFLSPIDRLRLELDETWKPGAMVESLEGHKMFVGLSRVFQEDSEALPHDDILARDAPGIIHARELHTQFGANVYLRMPEHGGELELWGRRFSPEEHSAFQLAGSYGLDKKL